jgi:ankyrin repeat protein
VQNSNELLEACREGLVEEAEKLLGPGRSTSLNLGASVNIEAKNADGKTPLIMAASGHCQLAMIKMLLNHKPPPNVNARDKTRQTALHYASYKGNAEVVRLLIERKASVNVEDQNGETPLMRAAYYNHPDTAELLLKNRADVNAHNEFGHSALYEASSWGYLSVVQCLLEHNANMNKDKSGDSCLDEARKHGRDAVVALLQSASARAAGSRLLPAFGEPHDRDGLCRKGSA